MNLKSKILKKFRYYTTEHYPNLFRPSSHPYISGDTFRNFSDHIFDEARTLDPKRVQKDDVVFLKTDLIDIYFNFYHKEIKNRYILITHNSDFTIGPQEFKYYDEKIKHWFTINLNLPNSKSISSIPIGIENRRFLSHGRIQNFKKYSKMSNNNKFNENIIFCSFNSHTNVELRKPLLELVSKSNNFVVQNFTNQKSYLNSLQKYHFNLCPEGNGIDTHRVWESLALGVTPICKKNFTNLNFSELGVPMYLITDWQNIYNIDIEKYKSLNKNKTILELSKYAKSDFWLNKIKKLKDKI